ncbi:hypothetical protein Poli38472_007759 [Pythium oligandrum]|uniref:FYVE-type domain-containing protein n=1 Tax=Pythium oligandrum TaxID=41045 RepID=A0A8K1FQM0_PYTOL|nr:hypothetical protein Poli38472_007759 [Pythium oligandrum]|eukprot:TMW68087.1 hypothetical protein Poli38472_007759 [Pythium oligandrum]
MSADVQTTRKGSARLPLLIPVMSTDSDVFRPSRGFKYFATKDGKLTDDEEDDQPQTGATCVTLPTARQTDPILNTNSSTSTKTRSKEPYLSTQARQNTINTSNHCTSLLVRQARDFLSPSRRARRPDIRITERVDGMTLYEQHSSKITPENDQAEAVVPASKDVPRILGRTLVKATLEEFVDTFEYNNGKSIQHLHPSMPTCDRVISLVNEPNKWISVNWMVLQPKGLRTRRRDFVVVECQKRFQMPDGRRGWVQSLQSVELPWNPSQDRDDNSVRGTFSCSGVVALESKTSENTIDLMVVAEIDLKGSASSGAHSAVSRHRVLKILSSMTEAIELHRVERLSYMGTQRFVRIEGYQKENSCRICTSRLGHLPFMKTRHSCRKCGASVCDKCSRIWNVERKRSTTLVGGGRVMTQTRVCVECVLGARQRKDKADASTEKVSSTTKDSKVLGTERSMPRSSTASTVRSSMAGTGMTLYSNASSRSTSTLEPVLEVPTEHPLQHEVLSHEVLSSMPKMRATQLEFKMSGFQNNTLKRPESDAVTENEDDSNPSENESSVDDDEAIEVELIEGQEVDWNELLKQSKIVWAREVTPAELRLSEL